MVEALLAALLPLLPRLFEEAVKLMGKEKAQNLLSDDEIIRANAAADLASAIKYSGLLIQKAQQSPPSSEPHD